MPAGTRSVTNKLTANTADLAYLTDPGFGVRVTNVDGISPIWFTVSHPGGSNPVPTVGGTNCFCAASVAGNSVVVRHAGQFGSTVQLISAGTPTYTVDVTGPEINA